MSYPKSKYVEYKEHKTGKCPICNKQINEIEIDFNSVWDSPDMFVIKTIGTCGYKKKRCKRERKNARIYIVDNISNF